MMQQFSQGDPVSYQEHEDHAEPLMLSGCRGIVGYVEERLDGDLYSVDFFDLPKVVLHADQLVPLPVQERYDGALYE